MASRIILPRLTGATEPLTLAEWKAVEGDWVERGTVILVVETIGIRHDIEAGASGFLHILVDEGNEAPIGAVAALIAETRAELEALHEEARKAEATPEVCQGIRVKSTLPFAGMRKTIAEHMRRSLSVSAPVTVMGEIDMTEMVKLRESLLAQEGTLGTRITYTDLLVFTSAQVLRDYPMINASIIGSKIKIWEDINIAVAVSIQEGLIAPVIKNADKKSLVEISRAVETLAQKAKERTLALEEVKGGTFTISNVGALGGGWRFDTLIINQPQSAILGTGGITEQAVVRDGQIVIRPIMTYSFTYDHRLIDGAIAVKFMNSLIQLLENPKSLTNTHRSF